MSHAQFQRNRFRLGLRTFGLAIAVFSLVALPGCQRLGLRPRGDDMSYLSEDEDDWSYPNQPRGQVPRPNFPDVRARSKSPKATGYPVESRYGLKETTSKAPSIVQYGTATDNLTSGDQNNVVNLLSTSEQEVDVDGALDSLPPAYRDILKKQLAVIQQKNGAISSPRTQPNDVLPPIVRKEDRAVSDTKVANQTTSPTESKDNNEVQKPVVSIRMNDSGVQDDSTKVLAAISDANVSSDSKVVLASATSPVPSNLVNSAPIPAVNTATVPVVTTAIANNSPTWRQSVNQAIGLLEKQIRETPASDDSLRVSHEITLRLLYVSQRRLDDALRPIEHLSGSGQEFVRHEMQALYEASNPDATPVRSRHWSLVMNSQREATNALAAASNLEVKAVVFCTDVERYGVTTKFPKSQFHADQEVLLYCEIENVAAEKVRNGFETQLQGSYEILDSQGRKVADQLLPMEPELCQNHRRDYFIVYKIYMPQQIASGNYQLRLTIEDMKARKFGQGQIDFQIKK